MYYTYYPNEIWTMSRVVCLYTVAQLAYAQQVQQDLAAIGG